MNFLKKFLGSSPKDDLSIIPSGQLFLKRSLGSPKSASECLYTDAAASVRETSAPHNYQLVVQRAFEEGEEQLKGDDDEEDDDFAESQDERVFLLDKSLEIYQTNRSGSIVVSWLNRDGDDGERFEFVVDESIKSSEVDQFMKTVYSCEYERKYNKSSAGVLTEQLQEFIIDPELETVEQSITKKGLVTAVSDDEEEAEDSIYEDADESKSAIRATKLTPSSPVKGSSKAEAEETEIKEDVKEPTGESIVEVKGELRLYDPTTESFSLQDSKADVSVLDLGKFDYWLSINGESGLKLGTNITSELNPVFNYELLSFVFNYETAKDEVFSWLLRFDSPESLLSFQTGYMRAAYEGANKIKWSKAEQSERKYVLDAFKTNDQDEEMDGYTINEEEEEEEEEDYDEEQEQISKPINLRTGLRKENFSDSEDEDEEQNKDYFKGSHNKNLTVAYKNDRSYVTRGDRIGVFKTTEDDELEFATAIENLSIGDKKSFNPSKMMLHTEDRALVMQGEDKDKLYRMDLEYGKIVDEWKVKDDLSVVDFGPSKKFNQLTGEQTFLGISDKGLFKIDPRVNGNKLVESEYKSYATKNDFSAFGTTENGHIAVASNKGDIRLYDRLGIRAKSLIPAIGDSIKYVETSADGKWILATCKTYLILIDAMIKDGANAGQLAFKKSFGKDGVPKYRTLRLSPEHVASMQQLSGQPLDFKKATFNTGFNVKEQTIISGSGPYAIQWSLNKILRGDAEPYKILRYSSNVVADSFKFGTDKNVIVALEDDVGIVNKRAFRKPDRQSLAYNPRKGAF
ncbi:Vacuolar import and degradation protein 27 [Wickerhamomyces ciferrii]|uniref:Vacuolar import and degradation protein 27 n=1 Tax=Wickerhamomyces ciferrii (strain ATCC 14091 / BCRC 22168 / CBS 111 / JCM 3599 / NBRC 0793 / NRRL Y-1031 F-60-10) TaxID=1206466 RepID=K0KK47_WICCF|nr:Vacuolar import and degradation protein 27 [Wickerhamomyces ciferrii]CCH41839.1 Vacuolar import and degradation protein 27 [Wickerhamomyces ciferrii]